MHRRGPVSSTVGPLRQLLTVGNGGLRLVNSNFPAKTLASDWLFRVLVRESDDIISKNRPKNLMLTHGTI